MDVSTELQRQEPAVCLYSNLEDGDWKHILHSGHEEKQSEKVYDEFEHEEIMMIKDRKGSRRRRREG
jgi:hypothetical protein